MRLIQAKRASEVLSVSLARLYELARMGVIPVVRLGPRQIRFDEDALVQWVGQGGVVAANEKKDAGTNPETPIGLFSSRKFA